MVEDCRSRSREADLTVFGDAEYLQDDRKAKERGGQLLKEVRGIFGLCCSAVVSMLLLALC